MRILYSWVPAPLQRVDVILSLSLFFFFFAFLKISGFLNSSSGPSTIFLYMYLCETHYPKEQLGRQYKQLQEGVKQMNGKCIPRWLLRFVIQTFG